MDERILKWLYDIKIAVEEIDGYFGCQEKKEKLQLLHLL